MSGFLGTATEQTPATQARLARWFEIGTTGRAAPCPLGLAGRDTGKEPEVAGKKRPKSQAQTEKKTPSKPKRPKKTSRGK
jgi:hypothetical protein